MKITSPTCVTDIIDYVDNMVHSPSPSADENEADSLHHQLVERWFRDRFFLPRPYRSTAFIYDDEDNTQNDIIDDGSSGRSMALFSDNLVSKEIRSKIVPVPDDEYNNCFSLRHRACGDVRDISISSMEQSRCSSSDHQRRPPMGVVMIVDTGAPLMPIDRDQDNDERIESSSKDGSDDGMEKEGVDGSQSTMGFIQRTFSFDEQLPILHRRRASSIRCLNKCAEEDDDCYIDEQPSFTIPVTYSNEGNRSKVVYPVTVPSTP